MVNKQSEKQSPVFFLSFRARALLLVLISVTPIFALIILSILVETTALNVVNLSLATLLMLVLAGISAELLVLRHLHQINRALHSAETALYRDVLRNMPIGVA